MLCGDRGAALGKVPPGESGALTLENGLGPDEAADLLINLLKDRGAEGLYRDVLLEMLGLGSLDGAVEFNCGDGAKGFEATSAGGVAIGSSAGGGYDGA